MHRSTHFGVALQQARRPLEQVLEVEQPLGVLPPLVLPEHPEREIGRDRRLVVAEPVAVGVRSEAPVLRPLDLRGEVARGAEAVRTRQRVADAAQEDRLRGEDPARVSLEVAEQRQRRRVEGRGAHAVGAERAQPRAELARRLVGERHRHDLLRREGPARHLPRDPARDRGRLAGSRAGEDAQRPARRFHGSALLGVQPFEDPLRVQVAEASGAVGRGPSPKVKGSCRPAARSRSRSCPCPRGWAARGARACSRSCGASRRPRACLPRRRVAPARRADR